LLIDMVRLKEPGLPMPNIYTKLADTCARHIGEQKKDET